MTYVSRTGPDERMQLCEAQLIAQGYRRASTAPDIDLEPKQYRVRKFTEAAALILGSPVVVVSWCEE